MKYLIFMALVAYAYGISFYFKTDMCPNNRTTGERWNLVDTCTECYCDHEGYGCSGCDPITPIIGCYNLPIDMTAKYPECCPRLTCPVLVPAN